MLAAGHVPEGEIAVITTLGFCHSSQTSPRTHKRFVMFGETPYAILFTPVK